MITLNGDTQKLQAVMSGAATTTAPSFLACWVQLDNAALDMGNASPGVLNGTTDVDLVVGVTEKQIKVTGLHVYNRDSAAVTISFKLDVSGTDYLIYKCTLQAGESVSYGEGGWSIRGVTGIELGPATADLLNTTLTGFVEPAYPPAPASYTAANTVLEALQNIRAELDNFYDGMNTIGIPGQPGIYISQGVPLGQFTTDVRATAIASSIVDGDTTHAPDGNSVFDALALKGALATINTWALAQTFTVAPVFTDSEGARDALKIGPRYCYESFMDFSAPTIGQTNLGSEWSRPVTGGTANLDNTAGLSSGNSYGRATLNLGTTATNKAAVAHQSNAHALGAGKAQFNIKGCLSSVSDGTDTYVQRNGFMDDVTAEPANGCYFRYTHSVNSGKWQCVTRKAGVETATDSGVTAVAGTERSWRVVVNAGGTSVDFYIDGSIVQTHIANIPTAGVGAASAAIRSAGTAAKLAMVIDVIHLRVDFTTPRW